MSTESNDQGTQAIQNKATKEIKKSAKYKKVTNVLRKELIKKVIDQDEQILIVLKSFSSHS